MSADEPLLDPETGLAPDEAPTPMWLPLLGAGLLLVVLGFFAVKLGEQAPVSSDEKAPAGMGGQAGDNGANNIPPNKVQADNARQNPPRPNQGLAATPAAIPPRVAASAPGTPAGADAERGATIAGSPSGPRRGLIDLARRSGANAANVNGAPVRPRERAPGEAPP